MLLAYVMYVCVLCFKFFQTIYLTKSSIDIADSSGRAVLRRGSAAVRLLGLRVRIPPEA